MNLLDVNNYKCEYCGAPMTASDTDGPVTELSMYCSRCGMSARLVFIGGGGGEPFPDYGKGGNGKQSVFSKQPKIEVKFEVPYGELCLDCPQQERFGISELECTSIGDINPRYVRQIVATCRLFGQSIHGDALAEMHKCQACLRQAK